MSFHRAQRPDGWRALVERPSEREGAEVRALAHGAPVVTSAPARAQPHNLDDPLALARWEDEGGPIDPRSARLPVNEVVRELVRACLIPGYRPRGA
jgi:hypothetical protein